MRLPIVVSSMLALAALFVACAPRPGIGESPNNTYTPMQVELVIGGVSEKVAGALVTPKFFGDHALRPYLGRLFVETEYQSDKQAVLVISHDLWVRRLASVPEAIGTQVTVDGRQMVIVGVAPPGFRPRGSGWLWIPKTAS